VLKGWHVLRHSFISALASNGIDQRIIDDLVGHATEEQRRPYRHLFPEVKQQALNLAFGHSADTHSQAKAEIHSLVTVPTYPEEETRSTEQNNRIPE
jgi:hypothetical protein